MKGFVITSKGQSIKVGVKDGGLCTIHLHYQNAGRGERNFVMIDSVDYDAKQRNIWQKFTPMNVKDSFQIKFAEMDELSTPMESVTDESIRCPMSKLDSFRQLENFLKEKGLL
ncbi:MAG: hypothetical protein IJX11_01625 [Bacteroidales bacterium]|nr:hypothetical protein [Bacteroidales bacterium]